MRIEFTKIVHTQRPKKTKTGMLLTMLQNGERGNMNHFAQKLKTNNDVVRGLICLLRKKGYQIFNRTVEGTANQTEYFLAKQGMKYEVNNKVHYTMDVPKGHHVLKVS